MISKNKMARNMTDRMTGVGVCDWGPGVQIVLWEVALMGSMARSGMGIIASMVNANEAIMEMRDIDEMGDLFYRWRIPLVGLVPRDVERRGIWTMVWFSGLNNMLPTPLYMVIPVLDNRKVVLESMYTTSPQ
jgi:hypothetical protein